MWVNKSRATELSQTSMMAAEVIHNASRKVTVKPLRVPVRHDSDMQYPDLFDDRYEGIGDHLEDSVSGEQFIDRNTPLVRV